MSGPLQVVASVWRDPGLRRVVLGFAASTLADEAAWIAILVYAYQRGGVTEAGLVAFGLLAASALASPVAALAGDRLRGDRVLAGSYAVRALCLGSAALAVTANAPTGITLGFCALFVLGASLTGPTVGAMLPSYARSPEDLVAANATTRSLENLGALLGPLAAAALLLLGGAGAVFAAMGVVAGVACLAVSTLGPAEAPLPRPRESGSLLSGALGGALFLRRELGVLLLVSCVALPSLLLGAVEVLVVAAAGELLGRGEHAAGYLTGAFGFGGLVGAALGVMLIGRRRLTPALCLGALVMGAPIAGVSATSSFLPALVLLFASGVGYSFAGVAGMTLIQRHAPDRLRARVFGLFEGLDTACLALGALLVTVAAPSLGLRGTLLAAGLLVGALLLLSLPRLWALDGRLTPPPERVLGSLRSDPIFAPLSAPALERLAARASWLEAVPGQVLTREGEIGDRYYRILEGGVEVRIGDRPQRRLGPGDGFGEIALLRAVPRTATVVARAPTALVAVERQDFIETVTGHRESLARADALATSRLGS